MSEFSFWELFESWEIKLLLSTILTVWFQAIEQFCSIFGADTLLVLLFFALVWLDLAFGLILIVKKREFTYTAIGRGLIKLPIYCLYLFLVGSVAISIQRSMQISIPLLNLFVSYMVASEAFVIISQLRLLKIYVPPLFLLLVRGVKKKTEAMVRKVLSIEEDKKPDD